MTDNDHRNEQKDDSFTSSSDQDKRLNRDPSYPDRDVSYPESAAFPENTEKGSEDSAKDSEKPSGQRSEWSHSSQPPRSDAYGAPVRGPQDHEADRLRQRRTRRIIGIVAVFLALAILLTAGAAAAVYSAISRRLPTAATLPTGPAATGPAATAPLNPKATTGATQAAASPSGQTSSTNKHFSIAEASAKQDPNKQALSIMEIAKRNKPAVVAISTEARIQNQFGQTGLVDAAGSGFIISKDGYVATNYHVIEGAQTISVTLDDGRIFPAVITGSDARNDLAVLKITGTDLPTVTLGDSKTLEVGELAVAIGNALGELKGTVTAGIISATDRQVTIENQSLVLLQTDAAINAGNSGGALINSFGEVIGINTAKNAGNGVEGLGFAIPINIAKPIIESLIQNGYVSGRPKLGIGTRDVTAQMAQYYNMREGVYVRSVEAGSAAAQAGIAVGDVIIKADGKDAKTTDALNAAKESHKVGDTMKITLVRDGKEMTVDVVLKEDIPDNVRQTASRG